MATETELWTRPAVMTDWPLVETTPLPRNIPELLTRAVSQFGDRPAWWFPDCADEPLATLTYSELEHAVARFATALSHAGVTSGSTIAVVLGNVPEFPLTWLAAGRLGAAIVPVNPASTGAELDHVATRAEVTHLVIGECSLAMLRTASHTTARLPAEDVIVGREEGEGSHDYSRLATLLAATAEASASAVEIDPDTVANIQFTSGTTGLPKGCMLTHRYWVTLGLVCSSLRGGPQRSLADHPFFYMQSQEYLVSAMWAGGALVVVPRMSRSRFFGWVDDHEIDFAWYIDVLHKAPPADPDSGRSLAFVPSTNLHGAIVGETEARYGITIRDHYASTEVGMGIVVPAERPDLMDRPGAIGFAAPFRETRIVDANLQDVPDGTRGELCIRGPGMLLGYYKDPDDNRGTFLDGGWFRTGDLVSRDEEGCHYFHGRIKDTIIRSGESISALEVEAVLRQIPRVRQAAVIGVVDPDRGEEVKAFLIIEGGDASDVDVESILAACRMQLAPFKVPRYVELRAELPMTGSGKVAKRKLREGDHDPAARCFDRTTNAWQ